MFSIDLGKQLTKQYNDPVFTGHIHGIDGLDEAFHASNSYWSRNQYFDQWRRAIQFILEGNDKACFITSMYNPKSANFIVCWPLYREKNKIYLQNHYIELKKMNKNFDIDNIHLFIEDRVKDDETSEWIIPLEDFKKLFKILNL